jgi:hypothetical protein
MATQMASERPGDGMLHTPLCDLLGIEFPIIQAGVGGVRLSSPSRSRMRAGWEASAVSAGLPRTWNDSSPSSVNEPVGPSP